MPWSQKSPVDQRTHFISDYLRNSLSFEELCELYGISRKTGYIWVNRYLHDGPAGLEDQSRRPRSWPTQTPDHIVAALIEARQHHPSWVVRNISEVATGSRACAPVIADTP